MEGVFDVADLELEICTLCGQRGVHVARPTNMRPLALGFTFVLPGEGYHVVVHRDSRVCIIKDADPDVSDEVVAKGES